MKINIYDIMMELLTPAEQFNLTVLHNMEDKVFHYQIKSYGPNQEKIIDGISCPFIIGKLYQTMSDAYLIKFLPKNSSGDYNPEALTAEDVYMPANSIIIFMGVERFQFEKAVYDDSFSIYALKFLFEENIYYDLIPTRFNYDGFDWTHGTQQNVQHIMQKLLKNKLIMLENDDM